MRSSTAFDFFDQVVVVDSDSASVIDALEAVYSRQRVRLPATDVAPALRVRVHAGEDGTASVYGAESGDEGREPSLGSRIEVGERTVRVPDDQQLVHYAHLVLINAAASLVTDAMVLHAGAVVKDGLAVLLVGHSGWGKTTLTLEMVGRGWGFLSDDFALLRSDGIVEPFPRRVNLTDASLALLELRPPTGGLRLAGFAGREKWMIDIEELYPGSLRGPTPLAAMVLLGEAGLPGAGGADAPSEESRTVWRLELDHLPAALVERLAEIPGVLAVCRDGDRAPPVIELTTLPAARVVPHIDELSASHNVTVFSARRMGTQDAGATASTQSRFTGAPFLAPVLHEEAVPDVLAHALSLHGLRFLAGTSDRVLLDSIAVLRGAIRSSGAPIFRLCPGALSDTANVVADLHASLTSGHEANRSGR